MSRHWSGYSTSHSVESKKGVAKPSKLREKNTSNSVMECFFCENWTASNPDFMQKVISKALYLKNFSLQKHFYTKDLNHILSNNKTSQVICFKDMQCYSDDREYLRRFYKSSEYPGRIERLAEYYKFHQDIPRVFIAPTAKILSYHHNNKRRLEYVRINKMLQEENQPVLQTQAESPKKKDSVIVDRVLADLEECTQIDLNEPEKKILGHIVEDLSPNQITERPENDPYGIKGSIKGHQNNDKVVREDKRIGNRDHDGKEVKKEEAAEGLNKTPRSSISELTMKLSEIINRSHSQSLNLDILSYLDHSEQYLEAKVLNSPSLFVKGTLQKEVSSPIPRAPITVEGQLEKKKRQLQRQSSNQCFDSTKAECQEQNFNIVQPNNSTTNQQSFKSSEWFQSMKRNVPPNLVKKKPNRLICTSKEKINHEEKNTSTSGKVSVASPADPRTNNQSPAVSVAKIKNFEDMVRKKRYNMSTEMKQQLSSSREKNLHKSNASLYEQKGGVQASKTYRERSEESMSKGNLRKIDILKTKIKLSGSNNMTYRRKNNVDLFNKQGNKQEEASQYESQHQGSHVNKDIYTSVNIKDLTQQVNQQGNRFKSNTAQNVKITTRISHVLSNEDNMRKLVPKVSFREKNDVSEREQPVQIISQFQTEACEEKTTEPNLSPSKNVSEDHWGNKVNLNNIHKSLVFEKPFIRIRGNEGLRRNHKALTHREREYDIVPSREVSIEKNKKVAAYVLTRKDEHVRVRNRDSESPDSFGEARKCGEESHLKRDRSTKDIVKFFVEKQPGKIGDNQKRRAISTEKFRPEINSSHHKLSSIEINSMREHRPVHRDVNMYEKIYSKYTQGVSLKNAPKEGFIRVKSKVESISKDSNEVASARLSKLGHQNSKEILNNLMELEATKGGHNRTLNKSKTTKLLRKNTLEI